MVHLVLTRLASWSNEFEKDMQRREKVILAKRFM